jgi:hypothetical protein
MKTVEFETELSDDRTLKIPPELALTLPRRGKATVVVCIDMDTEDAVWRAAAYEHFLKDDSEDDAVYDKYR